MHYWWVNQNQTHKQEITGGYLWSPKRRSDGALNHFYETMRVVAPGDIVFSFVDTRIIATGVIQSFAYESPKPEAFGAAGNAWADVGWRVDIKYTRLERQVRPKDYINAIRPLLPTKYAPLRDTGDGMQHVYLTGVPEPLANLLLSLIGAGVISAARSVVRETSDEALYTAENDARAAWEQHEEQIIQRSEEVPATQRKAIIDARVGQGLFRARVILYEKKCRVTGIANPHHLIASHIKPWRHGTNAERINGENGLLLCPNIDNLFDRGFISFSDAGEVLISPVADLKVLENMRVETQRTMKVGSFRDHQCEFLRFHREDVFLKNAV